MFSDSTVPPCSSHIVTVERSCEVGSRMYYGYMSYIWGGQKQYGPLIVVAITYNALESSKLTLLWLSQHVHYDSAYVSHTNRFGIG